MGAFEPVSGEAAFVELVVVLTGEMEEPEVFEESTFGDFVEVVVSPPTVQIG